MAAQSFTQMLSRLAVGQRDAASFAFTATEKTEALQRAYDDPWVFVPDIDKTNTTVAIQAAYDLDEAYEDVQDVKVDLYNNGYPVAIGGWDYNPGTNQLILDYSNLNLAAGHTIWIYGKRKLTKADQVPTYLQNYVLNIAGVELINMLMADKTNRFLRNDTTMAELQAAKQTHMADAERLRRALPNRRAVRL